MPKFFYIICQFFIKQRKDSKSREDETLKSPVVGVRSLRRVSDWVVVSNLWFPFVPNVSLCISNLSKRHLHQMHESLVSYYMYSRKAGIVSTEEANYIMIFVKHFSTRDDHLISEQVSKVRCFFGDSWRQMNFNESTTTRNKLGSGGILP